MAFRPYTVKEVRDAAQAYGLDPDFVEAIYAAESSRGADPRAMGSRSVKTKSGRVMIRGPFQMSDPTASDIMRENRMNDVDITDPDVHLDLALKQMQKLQKMYNGDYNKMAQAYLGGPGSVGTNARDELGTSVGEYSNNVTREMAMLKGANEPMDQVERLASRGSRPSPSPSISDEMLGIPESFPSLPPAASAGPDPMNPTWSNLARIWKEGPNNQFALPSSLGGDTPMTADNSDVDALIQRLVGEEMDNRDYTSA